METLLKIKLVIAIRTKDLNLLKTVKKTIFDYQMIAEHDAVLVGVSGGPDSMALLDTLLQLKSELGITIAIAHLNHGIRGKDSDNDADFVIETAEVLGVKCHAERA